LLNILGKPAREFVDLWSQIEQHSSGLQLLYFTYLERFIVHNSNRSFFWTEDGYFEIGPIKTKSGEIACAVVDDGGLCILWKQEGFYELVGVCFILGFMDGEKLEVNGKRDSVPQDVYIMLNLHIAIIQTLFWYSFCVSSSLKSI
jgi:hypothetical protein